MAGIYKLTAPNGKCYIGQSLYLKDRLSAYKGLFCKNQRHLHRAIKKYGWESFKVEILWRTKHPERYRNLNVLLDTLEIAWIKKFDSVANGYNLQYGGSNGRPSEETKQKMSAAHSGRKVKDSTRRKLSKKVRQYDVEGKLIREWPSIQDAADFLGVTHAGISSVCRKINNTSAGFRWAYASEGKKSLGRITPKAIKRVNVRSVVQYSLQGERLKTWDSIADATRAVGTAGNSIIRVCNGSGYTAGGFMWRYTEEAEDNIVPKAKRRGKALSEGHRLNLSREVVQYSIEGKKIKTWESIAFAAGGDVSMQSNINKVCRGGHRTAGGFQWRYLSDGVEEIDPINRRQYLAVEQRTQEGKLVKTWESAKEASREMGVDSGSIHRVCKGKRLSAGGFMWKYAK